jgi:retinol dehydrogenase 12
VLCVAGLKGAHTANGVELTFGTNVLGHWYLTQQLLPALRTASTGGTKARVITLSSSVAYLAKGIMYDTLHYPLKDKTRRKGGEYLYSQSKLVRHSTAYYPRVLTDSHAG